MNIIIFHYIILFILEFLTSLFETGKLNPKITDSKKKKKAKMIARDKLWHFWKLFSPWIYIQMVKVWSEFSNTSMVFDIYKVKNVVFSHFHAIFTNNLIDPLIMAVREGDRCNWLEIGVTNDIPLPFINKNCIFIVLNVQYFNAIGRSSNIVALADHLLHCRFLFSSRPKTTFDSFKFFWF